MAGALQRGALPLPAGESVGVAAQTDPFSAGKNRIGVESKRRFDKQSDGKLPNRRRKLAVDSDPRAHRRGLVLPVLLRNGEGQSVLPPRDGLSSRVRCVDFVDSGLECELTGAKGRRTKFQTFDTAQLIVFAKSHRDEGAESTASDVVEAWKGSDA